METKQLPNLNELILHFGQQYLSEFKSKLGHYPVVEADEEWPSPCELTPFNEQLITWQPIKIKGSLNFDNVESALSITLHPSIKTYFTTQYSESIPANCAEGNLQLLFAWSEKDFERLQQNMIGHILMKQKLKQPITLFFALTDKEDIILTVDNESGEVWVEKVGAKPHKKVADSLASFIPLLSPDIYLEE
ncbi:SecY-interacting protein [Thalassotalea sp. 1_MG-2023]|uniref:SecY-interacting protein n=1 Tax=Thalassotalea sp. 1_MG-2023 TaxID=3062680 RepID=UPI0026E39D4D|nr:SecY-interacting protein [Thalassotalea sp. 1_MG-2023]MDO6426821.1 SecY-interacting protein [Thalassotalea sp. 1_MG-2023]